MKLSRIRQTFRRALRTILPQNLMRRTETRNEMGESLAFGHMEPAAPQQRRQMSSLHSGSIRF